MITQLMLPPGLQVGVNQFGTIIVV